MHGTNPTIALDVASGSIDLGEQTISLQLFDTAGQVIQTVRKIVATNLVLGIITTAVASWGAAG